MVLPRTWYYLILAGLAVVVAFVLLRSSDEDQILAHVEALRSLAEVREQQSTITQATVAREIGEHFSEQTSFDLTGLGHRIVEIPSRRELVQKVLQARASLASLELGLVRPELAIEGNSASVVVTGSALGILREKPGQFLEVHRVEITLRKEDDEWLITGGRHIRDERALNGGRPD